MSTADYINMNEVEESPLLEESSERTKYRDNAVDDKFHHEMHRTDSLKVDMADPGSAAGTGLSALTSQSPRSDNSASLDPDIEAAEEKPDTPMDPALISTNPLYVQFGTEPYNYPTHVTERGSISGGMPPPPFYKRKMGRCCEEYQCDY